MKKIALSLGFILFSMPALARVCENSGLRSLLEIVLELNKSAKQKVVLTQSQANFLKVIEEARLGVELSSGQRPEAQQKFKSFKSFVKNHDLTFKVFDLEAHSNHLEKSYLSEGFRTLKQTESILLSQAQLEPVEDIRYFKSDDDRGVGFILKLGTPEKPKMIRVEFHKKTWNLVVLSDLRDLSNGISFNFNIDSRYFKKLQKWNELERNMLDQLQQVSVEHSRLSRNIRATPGYVSSEKISKLANLETVKKYLEAEVAKVRESAKGDRNIAFRALVKFSEQITEQLMQGTVVEQYSVESRDHFAKIVQFVNDTNLGENDLSESHIKEFSMLIDEMRELLGLEIKQSLPGLPHGIAFDRLSYYGKKSKN